MCFTDQMNRELGRKRSTLVLTETLSNFMKMLNELFQKKALYHNLQNKLVQSSAVWIRNYSSIAMRVSSSKASPC